MTAGAAHHDDKLRDVLLLYGLSLSAGTSLDLDETCSAFVGMLMARKNLTRASVWLRTAETPTTGPLRLVHSLPDAPSDTARRLAASHPLMGRLAVEESFSCTTADDGFGALLGGLVGGQGAVAVFRLGDVGMLLLFVVDQTEPFPPVELRRLRNVINKFAVGLEGCLAHQRVLVSENKYRALFESSRDTVFISTPDGRFLDVNPAGVRMLGYDTREEVLALDISTDVFVQREDWTRYRQTLDRVGHVKDYEVMLRRRGGERVVALETSSAIRDDAGAVVGYRGILRDVTEQRALEMQLVQAQKMDSLGLLAGGIAHDFNNILCGILGYASLLQGRISGDDKASRHLRTIEQSARRAQELTSQLLGFARGGKYDPRPIGVESVVSEAVTLLERLIERNIRIELDVAGDLPPVEGDPAQLQQVVMNLCLNARDAMPGGGTLNITASRAASATLATASGPIWRAGPFVCLSVADTGVGMSKETVHRIFEPFFTTKENGKGTGLGLALVYGVVTNHGGFVDVQSALGQGSRFLVYLPASGEPVVDARANDEVLVPDPTGGCVLVADDDPVVRSLVRDVLEPRGYRVLAAEDGAAAVALYATRHREVDLVLLDMLMPRMDGLQAYVAMREINPGIRVVLSTGYSQDERAGELLRTGRVGFLRKPYDPNELLAAVQAAPPAGDEGASAS